MGSASSRDEIPSPSKYNPELLLRQGWRRFVIERLKGAGKANIDYYEESRAHPEELKRFLDDIVVELGARGWDANIKTMIMPPICKGDRSYKLYSLKVEPKMPIEPESSVLLRLWDCLRMYL